MQMCPESENHSFSHIFFLLGNLYVYSLDPFGGKGVSKF